MTELVAIVQEGIDSFDDSLERALFGTGDAAAVADVIERLCAEHLAPVAEGIFYEAGVGLVAGLRLVDGDEVVVKVHRWRASFERLSAVHAVQAHLAAIGQPAPRPRLGPTPLGTGIATVEDLRAGETADAHEPAVRAVLAAGLRRLVEGAAPLVGDHDVGIPVVLRPAGAPLYPEPHSVRFDFEATAAGAEWIDELAEHARRRLERLDGEPVIGHFDWRVQNLGFAGDSITAIYDWDSLGVAPEPVVVGVAAGAFVVDWRRGEPDPLPSLEEMHLFVRDYERARGRPFDTAEREVLDAANLALITYGARCLHSDYTFHPELVPAGDDVGWFRLLRDRGERAFTTGAR